jgi:S1-C subfamily serine protease
MTGQGIVLTNYHVVDGCASLVVKVGTSSSMGSIIASDPINDLALVRTTLSGQFVALLRESPQLRKGEEVMAAGFPLHGLLASEVNVTSGTISALAGLGDDTRLAQTTAPVQPGNSGGPLIDYSGRVVGVVVSKLNPIVMARAKGDIPQNVNFALKLPVIRAFLDTHRVKYQTAAAGMRLSSTAVAESARKFTALVRCQGGNT